MTTIQQHSSAPNGHQIIHTPWGTGGARYIRMSAAMMRRDRVEAEAMSEATAGDDAAHVH